MKQLFTYKRSLKSAIILLLIAQVFSTTLPYFTWLMECEAEKVELTEAEDTETEKEDNTDEKDKKLQTDLAALYFSAINLSSRNSHFLEIETFHHLAVTTPPPEHLCFS